MTVTLLNTTEQLQRHIDTWRQLRSATFVQSISSAPELYLTTVNAMGDAVEPFGLLFTDEDGPRCMVLGRISSEAAEHRVGYTTIRGPRLRQLDVVYGGVMGRHVEAHTEYWKMIREEVGSFLTEGLFDLVRYHHVPVGASMQCAHDEADDQNTIPSNAAFHWICDSEDGSFEHVLDRQSKKHRANRRRAEARLQSEVGGVEVEWLQGTDELDAFFSCISEITNESYQRELSPFAGAGTPSHALLQRAADEGWFQGCLLRAGETAIAYQVGVVIDGVYHLMATAYRDGFAAYSPGQLLLSRVLRAFSSMGIQRIDYGLGDAGYKRSYGTGYWQERMIHDYGRGTKAQVERGLIAGRDVMRSILGEDSRMILKQRWRKRLLRSAA